MYLAHLFEIFDVCSVDSLSGVWQQVKILCHTSVGWAEMLAWWWCWIKSESSLKSFGIILKGAETSTLRFMSIQPAASEIFLLIFAHLIKMMDVSGPVVQPVHKVEHIVGRSEINVNLFERKTVRVYISHYAVLGNLSSASRHVCWDGKKFSSFTEWQHSLYHPSLRVTQAYDVSVTLFMPLAAECTFYHGSTSPSLVLPVCDDFLPRRVT